MSKLEFKADDFQKYTGSTSDTCGIYLTTQSAANAANWRLAEMLKDAQVVYGQGIEAMKSAMWCMNGPDFEVSKHTHRALLVNIEELPKKERCKHELNVLETYTTSNADIVGQCKHCGVKLVARWEPVE